MLFSLFSNSYEWNAVYGTARHGFSSKLRNTMLSTLYWAKWNGDGNNYITNCIDFPLSIHIWNCFFFFFLCAFVCYTIFVFIVLLSPALSLSFAHCVAHFTLILIALRAHFKLFASFQLAIYKATLSSLEKVAMNFLQFLLENHLI